MITPAGTTFSYCTVQMHKILYFCTCDILIFTACFCLEELYCKSMHKPVFLNCFLPPSTMILYLDHAVAQSLISQSVVNLIHLI
ncbi:hypothetical protein FKM82_006288 [Ascaphus truei]